MGGTGGDDGDGDGSSTVDSNESASSSPHRLSLTSPARSVDRNTKTGKMRRAQSINIEYSQEEKEKGETDEHLHQMVNALLGNADRAMVNISCHDVF